MSHNCHDRELYLPSKAWSPKSLEDRLLDLYLRDNPGHLFLEVEVGQGDENCGPRRLDGLLIPGGESRVCTQGSFSRADIAAAVQGKHVHVLEAKRKLNRTVIGQVQVGVALLERMFAPTSVRGVAVYALGNPDLEWYCREQGIQMAFYPKERRGGGRAEKRPDGRVDRRKQPNEYRRRAFMKGWDNAVAGILYDTIHTTKTHANMGNLFGWIYGDMPDEFRVATWEQYVGTLGH
jgi:hypothetical protein